MPSVLESLNQALGTEGLQKISQQLGADEETTNKALSAALPVILEALSRNAASAEGAQALSKALEKDHDGSALDNVEQTLNQAQEGAGDGILRHVLGEKRSAVEANVSRATGMEPQKTQNLFAMAAPFVMGALGRMQKQQGMDANGVASLLFGEKKMLPAQGLVGKLLDADGDGDLGDDLLKMGGDLLGGLFGGGKKRG